jgi:hypothetical protein
MSHFTSPRGLEHWRQTEPSSALPDGPKIITITPNFTVPNMNKNDNVSPLMIEKKNLEYRFH